jgi:2-haloalkanoic acid dehalogenase type II
MSFGQFKVLTFDCYGTLIDWERGLIGGLKEAGYKVEGREGELLALFSKFESPVQVEHPTMLYPQILELTLERLAKEREPEGGPLTPEMIAKFGESVQNWPAFPDSPTALAALRQRYKLVILSNVDRTSFSYSEAKLGVKFDLVITAQDVKSYKPALNHFHRGIELAAEKFGAEKSQILHVFQSLYHDAVPANRLGIATCHINRPPLSPNGGATPVPAQELTLNYIYDSLEGLEAAHKSE